MDILCTPDDPAIPVPESLYYCQEEWDGGDLFTYPLRKGRVRLVPLHLRQHHPDLLDSQEPYLEGLYPTPQDELDPFIQTWLLFGLVSEFFGLNDTGDESSREVRAEEIKKLHKECIIQPTQDGNGTPRRISGRVLLRDARHRIASGLDLEPDRKKDRIIYLHQCLQFSSLLLNTLDITSLDTTVRSSIAAIGELFTLGLWQAAREVQLSIQLATCNWYPNYIDSQRIPMIQQGWCPSMLEKIRSQNQGVMTMHYISRLRLPAGGQSHGGCTENACKAFQIDMARYQLRHADPGCLCSPPLELKEQIVCDILKTTDSFPVLKVDSEGIQGSPKLSVETWQSGIPYVAISHVWADGLGNPRKTSLQQCQVSKISRLIKSLQETARAQAESQEGAAGNVGVPYRLWIDTLCCPIELTHKGIALTRIADVYRQATHVLVLDSSLMAIKAEDRHPAELLLRILSVSPWMRRLWTLQEGALAKSLWVQFTDKAVSCQTLILNLFQIGRQDFRYMRIWNDVMFELNQFQGLNSAANQDNPQQSFSQRLANLQTALHFRTVSNPADEALCIGTLMGLETRDIISQKGTEARMVALWRALAQAIGGAVSSRIVFLAEETLSTQGWRWAPKSWLLSSLSDPWLGISERISRFYPAPAANIPGEGAVMGFPTPLGLRVTLPGCLLIPRAQSEDLGLHPWHGTVHPTEDAVLARDSQGRWVQVIDYYRSLKIAKWTRDEVRDYDRRANNPLCREIDTGRCALIYDHVTNSVDSKMKLCCMLQVEQLSDQEMQMVGLAGSSATSPRPLKGHRERTVLMAEVGPSEAAMMDTLERLAGQVAASPLTRELKGLAAQPGDEWEETLEKVRQYMKSTMKQAWEELPGFRKAVEEHIGQGLEDYVWTLIPKRHSHATIMRDVPEHQTWIVD